MMRTGRAWRPSWGVWRLSSRVVGSIWNVWWTGDILRGSFWSFYSIAWCLWKWGPQSSAKAAGVRRGEVVPCAVEIESGQRVLLGSSMHQTSGN